MTEFSFQVDAVSNKSDYCYVYRIGRSHGDGKLLIQNFPSYVGSSCFPFKFQNDESKRSKFELYVTKNLLNIISGNDAQAMINSLIVEHDFSLTITINATQESVFNPDSYVEFEMKTDIPLSFGLTISKNDTVTEYYSIQLYGNGDVLQIFEYSCDGSDAYLEWPQKSMLIFRKYNYPKIEVTQFH